MLMNDTEITVGSLDNDSSTTDNCYRSVQFDQILVARIALAPAAAIILVLAFLQRRRHLHLKCWRGRPGVPLPLNISCTDNRHLYVAGFSVTAWLLLDMMRKHGNVAGFPSTHYTAGPVKFLSCLVAGVLCYPIFGGVTSQHWLGYLLGSIYTWGFTVFYVLTHHPCENSGGTGLKSGIVVWYILGVIRFVPCLLWLAFLCVYYPKRFLVDFLEDGGYFSRKEPRDKVPYYVYHVRQMLSKISLEDSGSYSLKNKKEYLIKMLKKIYTPMPGFRYSMSVLTAVAVSTLLVYLLALEFVSLYYLLVENLKVIGLQLKQQMENLTGLDPDQIVEDQDLLKQYDFWVNIIAMDLFASLGIAFSCTALSLLSTLKQHRLNLLNAYKGVFPYNTSLPKSARSVVVKSTRYVGYQFGYAVWGFAVQTVVLLILISILTIVLVIVFYYKNYSVLLSLLEWIGPTLGYIIVLMYLQQTIVHCFFLRRDDIGRKTLAINNRSWFINYQYFMVFASSALGLMSCFMRIMKAIVYGLWSLPRLDRSTLSRQYESADTGFAAYVSFLKMEIVQTNPTALTFIYYLSQTTRSAKFSKYAAKNPWQIGRYINVGQWNSDSDDDENGPPPRRRPRIFRPRINFDRDAIDTRQRFRLTPEHVDILLDQIGAVIDHDTDRNCALSPRQQIMLSLRYLATGDNFRTIGACKNEVSLW